MRRLADRREIRKPRFAFDRELGDACSKRDFAQSFRVRNGPIPSGDQGCRRRQAMPVNRLTAIRRGVREGRGSWRSQREKWRTSPVTSADEETAGSRRSARFAQGCVYAGGKHERASITRGTAAIGGGNPTPFHLPSLPRSRSCSARDRSAGAGPEVRRRRSRLCWCRC